MERAVCGDAERLGTGPDESRGLEVQRAGVLLPARRYPQQLESGFAATGVEKRSCRGRGTQQNRTTFKDIGNTNASLAC
nr:hypothetical protein [Tanacetum cinerariifolium]